MMDIPVWAWAVIIVALIFLPPVLLFRPLVLAISNRIAGKAVNTDELKMLRKKVEVLEQQVMQMQQRIVVVEDGHEFSKKMLEDVAGKTAAQLHDKEKAGNK